jgi:hypothetical protein
MGRRIFGPQRVVCDDSEPFPKRVGELAVVLVHEKKFHLTAGPFKSFRRDRVAAGQKIQRVRDDKSELFGGKLPQELVKGVQADIGSLRFMKQNDVARTN